jgi:hypothetical protein
MIELYEPSEMVESFYAMVKSPAVGFDGAAPVPDFAFLSSEGQGMTNANPVG